MGYVGKRYVDKRAVDALRKSEVKDYKQGAIEDVMDVWNSPVQSLISGSSGIVRSMAGLTGTVLHGANEGFRWADQMGDKRYTYNKDWINRTVLDRPMERIAGALGGEDSAKLVRDSENSFPILNSFAERATDVAGVLSVGKSLLTWGSPVKIANKGVHSTVVMKDPLTGKEFVRRIFNNGKRKTTSSTRLNNNVTEKVVAGTVGGAYVVGGEAVEDKLSR